MKKFFNLYFLCVLILNVICVTRLAICDEAAPQKEFAYDDQGRRDPFWPLVDDAGVIINYETDLEITDLLIEGIMAGANNTNVAIINGRIVQKNDKIGKYVVKEVKANSVVLMSGEKQYELKFKQGGN